MATEAIQHVREQKEKLMERIQRMRAEHATGVRETVGAGITVATAFGLGWFEGRYPDKANVAGIPITLFAGGVLLGLAAFEVGGKEDSIYLGDAGRGALAAWAAKRGADIGASQLAEAA